MEFINSIYGGKLLIYNGHLYKKNKSSSIAVCFECCEIGPVVVEKSIFKNLKKKKIEKKNSDFFFVSTSSPTEYFNLTKFQNHRNYSRGDTKLH